MKIAFGMIVFESDYVLYECLKQIYPYASQILIAEGPVKYWQDRGRTTSTDNTNKILQSFPDPENKIKVIHGQWQEKDQQSNAYIKHIDPNTEYLWMVDADEIYKSKDIETTIEYLRKHEPTSLSVQLVTFYGGFDRYLTGYEQSFDCKRIFKLTPGCTWLTHRPPTIKHKFNINLNHVNGEDFSKETGVYIYHYSYVFPTQVKLKLGYYKEAVSKSNCIDNYFEDVYLKWMQATDKMPIERIYNGVHEFKTHCRTDCYTAEFKGSHPEAIEENMENLKSRISNEIENILNKDHIQSWKNRNVFLKQLQLNRNEFNSFPWPKHWNDYITLLGMINAKSVLDIGCGSGIYGLLSKDLEYTGIDYSTEAIEIAKNNWPGNFLVMDYKELTKEFVSKFDVIHAGALFDVLPNGNQALEFILSLNPKSMIIGRIETTTKPSHYTTYRAYDEIVTYRYFHNVNDLNSIFKGWIVTKRNNSILLTQPTV